MGTNLNDKQQAALRALCDTYVPSINVPEDPSGFWARRASDLNVDRLLVDLLSTLPDPLVRALLQLLDLLLLEGFCEASQFQREQRIREIAASSPEAASGLTFFEKQTLLFAYGQPEYPGRNPHLVTYGAPSPSARNPNWEVLRYPGPISVPKEKPKRIQTLTPNGGPMSLDADICIVGSGAGGAVIASRLSMLGYRVVVLEAGGYFNSADFRQLELWSYHNLWYRGGATPTANGTVNMLAGATLGGGTEINWMNCIRTPNAIRTEWTRTFGLDGVDSVQFDKYLDDVESRLSVNSKTAQFNGPNLRMREGCQKLGYLTKQTKINWDPKLFNPLMAGYTGLGDQSGGKQTARRTFLVDAYHHGAQFVINCRAQRILLQNGCATGVEAIYSDRDGRKFPVVVSSRQVVVACGSLESPALLLRSGINGPAVGRYLRLQPGGAVYGVYKDEQRGWWGSPMTANCEQFVDTGDGFGFYMEIPAFAPGFYASVIPWASGREHKELMAKVPFISTFIWFLRDKGFGSVTVDPVGNSVTNYEISDETDQRNFRMATAEAIRIHEAAGANEIIFGMRSGYLLWKRGQSLERFIQHVSQQPLLGGSQPIISAHQLCTCRMGRDPSQSVANTAGEVHDVEGVWIGDGSACPTALGANPMITIMALARRTAENIAIRLDQASSPRRFNSYSAPASNAPELPDLAATLLREMARVMSNPFRLLTSGQRLATGLENRRRNSTPGTNRSTPV